MGKLRQVAIINGMEVWSDKEGGISIENDEVTFEDGSSCNTKKGKIINAGKGSIELRLAETSETRSQIVIGPKTFASSGLVIENVRADIEIEPHEKKTIEVTISGTQTDCDTIGLNEIAGQLHIDHQEVPVRIFGQREPEQNGAKKIGFIDSIKKFLQTPISVKILSVDAIVDSKPAIKIKVPKGTAISIKDTDGELTIGNTEGPLELDIDNSDGASLGKIKNASLTSSGEGNVNVSRVDGTLVAILNGYGDITIEEGVVSNLKVETNDAGHFEFGGTSQNGDLACNSGGNITVEKINGTLVTQLEGSGNMTIADGTIIDLKISTNDDGDFEFQGKAQNAELESNANGLITIREINGDLKATIGDSGYADITVEQGNLKNLTAKVENDGNIDFQGKTENADLSIEEGASGDIHVAFSLNRPYKDNDGDGDIIVENWS